MDRAFSDSEMRAYLPHATILTYPMMVRLASQGVSLQSMLGTDGVLVLLYEVAPRRGHWTWVFQRKPRVLECFDSYGYIPDDELNFVPAHYREESQQNHSHLLRLLQKSNCRVEYNKAELQSPKPGVNTCGRHCIARLAFRDMGVDKYAGMVGRHCDVLMVQAVPSPA